DLAGIGTDSGASAFVIDCGVEQARRSLAPGLRLGGRVAEDLAIVRAEEGIEQPALEKAGGGLQRCRHQNGIDVVGKASATDPVLTVAPLASRAARFQ